MCCYLRTSARCTLHAATDVNAAIGTASRESRAEGRRHVGRVHARHAQKLDGRGEFARVEMLGEPFESVRFQVDVNDRELSTGLESQSRRHGLHRRRGADALKVRGAARRLPTSCQPAAVALAASWWVGFGQCLEPGGLKLPGKSRISAPRPRPSRRARAQTICLRPQGL